MTDVEHEHSEKFRPDADKPHECVPVRLGGAMGYRQFCANDGQPWPCPVVKAAYLQEHYDKHGKRI